MLARELEKQRQGMMDTPGESRGHGLQTNLERQKSEDTGDSLSGELEG